jgi:oligopeptidase B
MKTVLKLLIVVLTTPSCRTQEMSEDLKHQPPQAREFPVKHRHHGIVREDPWHWMRERDNPKVLAHLEAENAYTEAVMQASGDLVETLYHELLGRIEESNRSAPYPEGPYLYQSRIEKGQDYRMYFRQPRSGGGEWELYFDANKEAEGTVHFDLGFLDISPDGTTLAYAVDTAGEESYLLKFRDLATGRDLPLELPEVSADGEWDAAGKAYYFIREDETRRPFRVYRIGLGDTPDQAVLVYEEPDPLFYAGIYKSQDGRFILASSASKETTEVGYLPSDSRAGSFKTLFPRRTGIQYWVEHQHGNWLVRTNEDAPDYRLLSLPAGKASLDAAEEIVPAREGVRLTEILPLRDYLLLFERSDGLDHIRVRALSAGEEHVIAMPESVYDLQAGINMEFDTELFQFNYSSPIRPSSTFRYNLATRESEKIRETRVPSGHDPERYTACRIKAVSHDGTSVPMTVIHARDLPLDGSRPAYLYGYGAYGSTVEADFRTSWLTWLQRGCTVAIAHVRGGGLLGEQWYRDGKLAKKENTFRDFIACAEALVGRNYTRPERLVMEGGSAGGLLVGAVLNRRPDLFRAVVAAVPFVDVINTMLDPSLPLTTFEYEEWGNPEEGEVFQTLMSYSPYDNVRQAAYPAILVTAGYNDPRVPYWEAAKWVAKLRKHQTASAPILLKTNLEAGHMGASARYGYWKEIAFEQAFLLWQLQSALRNGEK